MTSLALKSTLWPTVYAPCRKGDIEPWSKGKVRWAEQAVSTLLEAASKAPSAGEVKWFP